ncbi:MAG: hypothetical protein RLZZ316_2990 [Bacteroidota bacterium]
MLVATSLRRTLRLLRFYISDLKLKMSNQKLLVEVCDATGAEICTTAGNQKNIVVKVSKLAIKKTTPGFYAGGFI